MIRSMTGFGMCTKNEGKTQVRVEVKSVNHRFFDFSINGPIPMFSLEDQVRKMVHSVAKRGAITLFLAVDGAEERTQRVETNWSVVDQYIEAAKEIQRRSGTPSLDLGAVLQFPGIFSLHETDSHLTKDTELVILDTVREACAQLVTMREREGHALKGDLIEKTETIQQQVDDLAHFIPIIRQHYEQKLRETVNAFLNDHQMIDEDRLMNEIALYANRTAIDEELTRMKSHMHQFLGLLNDETVDAPIGRRLDFFIQEMNREINTIGSKGNHVEISQIVVSIKSDLEKLREQVQNVE
ncbi:YicC/YloC family endoribonuclease [Sporolactobacillus kofuensis]|uniref:YicC/YloC family endoribonuclease n=1 Tax=Sporolactobacillus kofuensis TaxID=269672 RepID=A0ABW1WBP8_9BACL|nr:YicC/YloC family endoribonuclease [Sporolactobacillus kofuensis]MCO7174645.1 YicC family protein [Sporolactobacillus kofuensis]